MNKVLADRELLPCPFCGSQAELEDHRTIWAVRCVCGCCVLGERAPEPEADMPLEYWSHFEKSAIDAWNRRAQPAEAEGVEARLRRVIEELKAGFVACQQCGDQEDTATLDCVPELEAIAAVLSAVTAERDAARTDLATVIGQRDCYANQVLRLETTVTAERDRLRDALRPFSAFEAVRSQQGGCTPKHGTVWAVASQGEDAEITVEHLQEAVAAMAAKEE